jgi:hypothetical protein
LIIGLLSMVQRRSKLAVRPRSAKPWRDVLAAVSLKLVLLTALYLLFFSPAHRPPADSSATALAVVGESVVRSSR